MMIININAIQINWLEITCTIIFLIVSGLLLLYHFVHNPKLQDKLSVLYENTKTLWNKTKLYTPRTKTVSFDDLYKINFFYKRDKNSTLYKTQIDLLDNKKASLIGNIYRINIRIIKVLAMWAWVSGCVNISLYKNKIIQFIRNWCRTIYFKHYWIFKKNLSCLYTNKEYYLLSYIIMDATQKIKEIKENSLILTNLAALRFSIINNVLYFYSIWTVRFLTKTHKSIINVDFSKEVKKNLTFKNLAVNGNKLKNQEEITTEFIRCFANINNNIEKFIKNETKPLYWGNFKDHSNINIQKLMPYECGFEVFGDARMLFDVHFYLVSMLFLIFDIEVAYLFPYILCANVVGTIGFKIMLSFLAILTVGLIYEWVKGALNWLQTIYKKNNDKIQIENYQKRALTFFSKEEKKMGNKFIVFSGNKNNDKILNYSEIKTLTVQKGSNKLSLWFAPSVVFNNQINFDDVYYTTGETAVNLHFDFKNIDYFIFHFFTEIIILVAIISTIFLFVYYKSKGFANSIEKQQYIWSSYIVRKTWLVTCLTLFICLLFYANAWLGTAQLLALTWDKLLNYIYVWDKQITKGFIQQLLFYLSFALKTILPDFIIEGRTNSLIYNFQHFPTIFNETIISNATIASIKVAITGFAFVLIYFSLSYQLRIKIWEFNTLFLLFLSFALLSLSSNNYFIFFVTIEGMNLCLFVLITLSDKYTSIEVAIKYLILNIISTTALLLGICFTYLATGSLQFDAIELAIIEILNNTEYNSNQLDFIKISLLAILVGIFFKLSIAPFHFWTLDIYEGVSYPILSTLAILIKMTIFGVLLRLLTGPYSYLYYFTDFKQVFFYVGTLSILIGGILGLLQWTVKRFFAATSINNMGFILICLSSPTNIETALYYLFIYNSLLILTFALLSNTWLIARNRYDNVHFINSLNGLASNNIKIATILTILILSMSGLPPFIIFFNKMSVLLILFENYSHLFNNYINLLESTDVSFINNNILYYIGNFLYNNDILILFMLLAIIITSVVVAYYYIKLVLTMWLNKPNINFVVNFMTGYKNPLKNTLFFETRDLIGFEMHRLFKRTLSKENIYKIFNRKYPLIQRELQYNVYNANTNKLLGLITFAVCLIGIISPLILIYDYGLIESLTVFTFNFTKTSTAFFI